MSPTITSCAVSRIRSGANLIALAITMTARPAIDLLFRSEKLRTQCGARRSGSVGRVVFSTGNDGRKFMRIKYALEHSEGAAPSDAAPFRSLVSRWLRR